MTGETDSLSTTSGMQYWLSQADKYCNPLLAEGESIFNLLLMIQFYISWEGEGGYDENLKYKHRTGH
jgi:hypothetical protein